MNYITINFKRTLISVLCFLSILCSCACQEQDSPKQFTFKISGHEMVFPLQGDKMSLSVDADAKFKVLVEDKDKSWLHSTIKGNEVVMVADKSPNNKPRSTTFKIVAKGQTKLVKVIQKSNKIALGYLWQEQQCDLDPEVLTHINYAFGDITGSHDGLYVNNEENLKRVVAYKNKYPHLKVLISVNGATQDASARFVAMTKSAEKRHSFAVDCKRVLDKFNVDGIDLDWETPYGDQEIENFNQLVKELRKVLGNNKLITFASTAFAHCFDFKTLNNYVDYVNIMGYDIDRPPYHHSGLYRSKNTKRMSIDESVKKHIAEGIPAEKLVMGIPFYGLGPESGDPVPGWVDFRDINNVLGCTKCWDEVACAPYLADSEGNLVLCYDDTRSIACKCKYVKENNLLGIMYWTYGVDDANGSLRNAVYRGLND